MGLLFIHFSNFISYSLFEEKQNWYIDKLYNIMPFGADLLYMQLKKAQLTSL